MSMQCNTVSAQLIAYLKGELAAEDADRIASHIAACSRCQDEACVLGSALTDIERLPTFRVSFDIRAIEEAASHQALSHSLWWRFTPVAACVVLLAILGFLYSNRPSTSQLAHRPQPTQRQQATAVIPLQHPPVKPAPDSPDQRQLSPRRVISAGFRPRHHAIASQPRRAVPQKAGPISNPPREEPASTVDANAMIAQYVDTIAMCMAQSDRPRAAISCALLPVTAADDRDLPAADTLTAALVCAFNERHAAISLKRLPPSLDTDIRTMKSPPPSTTGTGDYLIVGNLAKSKSGYLLSLYAINTTTDAVIFDGKHPILLPPGMFS